MEKNNSDIFIICGERSGDLHGSHLIKKLLNENSSLKIHCWGGEMMQKAGGILLEDYKNYNLMGFWEVLKGLRFIYTKIDLCKKHILKLDGIDITPLGHFTENKKRILVSKNGQEINMESEGWNHF